MSSKECKHPTCSGNSCRRKKTKQKKIYNLKRTPIAKMSAKKRKTLPDQNAQFKADQQFYLGLWDDRPHISFESKEPLGNEPLTLFFHHILEKGVRRFKQFRHCSWNIVFLTWQEHDQVRSNIDKLPKVNSYTNFLLFIFDKYGDITDDLIKDEYEKRQRTNSSCLPCLPDMRD